ncbi:RNA polymerase factor sigma-54 [bacterium]|nr:RNA polymerase factor sigma-54 [bacterium]
MSSSLKMQQQQSLVQKPELKMTVQMRQSIEMLLKNQFELREMILEEVSENPFLEIESWGDEQEELPPEQDSENDGGILRNADVTVPLMISDNSDDMSNILADFDWEQIRETSSNNFGDTNLSKSNDLPENFSFENTIPEEESFSQSLDFQISMSAYPESLKDVMIYMAYNLDSKGFLADSDEDIAAQIAADAETVAEARAALKNFEPFGCGCRNFSDYLRFIFIEHGSVDVPEKFEKPVNMLFNDESMQELLVKKNFDALCSSLGISKDDLSELLLFFRSGVVSPYPAFGYEQERTEYVKADLMVFVRDGEPVIYIDDKMLPTVVLKTDLFEENLKNVKNRDEKHFIKEKYKNAEWIIKTVSERNRTLYQVASSIFAHQKAFLEHGDKFLKPLTLKDVSDDIGRHIATVSRLTNGKYAQTPHGIFELKYFFVKQVNDNLTTNKRLEQKIVEIIEGESRENPYSDDDIAHILSREGIDVARRTVAKYRSKMNIPLARERKRNYQFEVRN